MCAFLGKVFLRVDIVQQIYIFGNIFKLTGKEFYEPLIGFSYLFKFYTEIGPMNLYDI